MWRKLRAWAAEMGWPVALLYALHRVLEAASGGRARIVPYAFVAQPLGAGQHRVSDGADTEVRLIEPGDPLSARFPRPTAVNAARWASGARCWAATVKGEFAGTIWIRRAGYDEDEVRCDYHLAEPERSVWDFDVYVEPRYRLGRTMARLWKSVDDRLAAEGARWTFSRISLFNAASLNSHARLGAVRVGSAVFVVIGPGQLGLGLRPLRFHLSGPGGRMRIVLGPPGSVN
jgi:hypothetical protein